MALPIEASTVITQHFPTGPGAPNSASCELCFVDRSNPGGNSEILLFRGLQRRSLGRQTIKMSNGFVEMHYIDILVVQVE